jgi:drug/metabolite transporter (DMT)-like permease
LHKNLACYQSGQSSFLVIAHTKSFLQALLSINRDALLLSYTIKANKSPKLPHERYALRMPSSKTIKVNLALLSSITIWSISFVAIRFALRGYSPASLSFIRYVIASIGFAFTIPFIKPSLRIGKKQLLWLLLTGAIGTAGYSLLLNKGEIVVLSAIASFIIAQTPVLSAILAISFLKEKPSQATIFGIGISFFGVAIIVTGHSMRLDLNVGLLLITGATFCGSLQSIWQKKLLQSLDPLCVSAFSVWFAALTLIPFTPHAIAELKVAAPQATLAALFLGIMPSMIGMWLWNYGLSKTTVVRATTYLYAMPIFSTFFGWLLLDEIPVAQALLGGSIALFGVIFVKKDTAQEYQSQTNKS